MNLSIPSDVVITEYIPSLPIRALKLCCCNDLTCLTTWTATAWHLGWRAPSDQISSKSCPAACIRRAPATPPFRSVSSGCLLPLKYQPDGCVATDLRLSSSKLIPPLSTSPAAKQHAAFCTNGPYKLHSSDANGYRPWEKLVSMSFVHRFANTS